MKNLLTILLIVLSFSASAQECTCTENLEWVKKTFEENDAGFQFTIDRKGEVEYRKHNAIFAEKVKTITNSSDCVDALYDWLMFFRKGHIDVDITSGNQPAPVASASAGGGKDAWETVKMTDKQFRKYLTGKKLNGLEGIWKSEPYTIGIVKQGSGYTGFIIDGGNTGWQKNQVKLKITSNGGKLDGTYYLRNFSPYPLKDAKMLGNNAIQLGDIFLSRVNPETADPLYITNYIQLQAATAPMMQQHSENTLVLRIPSFSGSFKPAIDSVLKANRDKILQTPNLVIDIRNNGGGSDGSYHEIIPYLYTGPIRTVRTLYRSTPLNNKRMEGYLEYKDLSDKSRSRLTASLKKLNENLGKFVNLNDEDVYIDRRDTVYEYPKNVAILINNGNASTSEQFLLEAKQSAKTKLFGTTTAGILDISNMHTATSSCGVVLRYCITKSLRIPHMAIDDKGIQPDYYLDSGIPQHEWVQYAEDSFQNNNTNAIKKN